jgi:RNA polymerase primary sigma factor
MPHTLDSIKVGRQNPVSVERTSEFAKYLTSIASYKPLTIEEEVALGEKIQSSPKDYNDKPTDRESVDKLVNANLGFVVSVAKQYAYCAGCLTILDLISEGNMGLVEAAETYDPTKGFKFISYAVNYIRMHILDALTNKSRIVADYHKGVSNQHTSLDAPTSEDNDTTYGDVLCTSTDADTFHNDSLATDLMRVLNNVLKPQEVTIICIVFGINTPAKKRWEIAEQIGCSQERVRQIEQKALYKLRNNQQALVLLEKYQG